MENLFFRVLVVSAAVSVVLLPLLALLPRWQRRYAAHTRKAVWLAVALVLLVVPLLPKNRAPVQLEAPQSVVTLPAARAETSQPDTPQPGGAAVLPPVTGQSPGLSNSAVVQPPSVGGDTPTPPVTPAHPARTIRWTLLFSALWLAGGATVLLWQLAAYLLARRKLMSRAVPTEDYTALAAEVCPRRRVRFFRVSGLETPMTLGLLRPMVLLPEGIVPQAAVRHELIHIRRWDVGYKALMLLACAVHWFDPLVWLMARRAGRDVEASCDAAVVAGGDDAQRREYGALLLRSAARKNVPFTTQFGSSKNQMKARLYDLFHPGKRSRALVAGILVACLLAGSLVACRTGGQAAGEALDHPAQGDDLDPEPIETPAPAEKETPVEIPKMTAEVAEAFRAVLLGEEEFICVYTSGEQKKLDLTRLGETFTGEWNNTYVAKQLAPVDLDADGVPEVVVLLSHQGSILLHYQDGVIYGYHRPVRWFNNVKADGVGSYSGGFADWGYCTLSFTEDGIVENEFLYCQSTPVPNPGPDDIGIYITYFENGVEISAEEFDAAVKAQDAKPDVVWYDIGDAAQMIYEATDWGDAEAPLSFPVRVSGGRKLTVVLDAELLRDQYYSVDRVLVYEGDELLQTIETSSLPPEEYYAWNGLFVNQGYAVGEPDVRDLNFDGAEDFGLLAVSTYPHNVPYTYFLWSEEENCFCYGFTLLGVGALDVDNEHQQLIEHYHDSLVGNITSVYKYAPDGSLQPC